MAPELTTQRLNGELNDLRQCAAEIEPGAVFSGCMDGRSELAALEVRAVAVSRRSPALFGVNVIEPWSSRTRLGAVSEERRNRAPSISRDNLVRDGAL